MNDYASKHAFLTRPLSGYNYVFIEPTDTIIIFNESSR